VILLPAGNASTWTGPTGNNTYLLRGAVPTLIDAGVGNPQHVDAIARALDGAALALLLVTHGHVDHVGGLPAIRARWPHVDVRQFGCGLQPLQDGERIAAGDDQPVVVHTPGHSPDHCCFRVRDGIFCGDLLRIGGTVVIPASRGGDLAMYLASLRRIRDLRPAKLFPAHGPIVDAPDSVIDEYLAHRLDREHQILHALTAAGATPQEIVSRVYTGLAPELIPAAEESVRAHLFKLRGEGAVAEHDGRWTRYG
jgi:glyoxylase-like metal-dependent hydrolase (beta-lactamase superfamily II)